MELTKEVKLIVNAAQDKKAFDINVLNIAGLSSIADYFVVASGNNERQAVAIADEIEDRMSEIGLEPLNKEGHQTGRWVLLDYGDIIVHVFHREEREFYNLEKLWVDAESIEIEDII
ncbi:ribosomal silencing factor RsfS [Andreesenia angusta]|uniref:Ribosomal silencing factor RsfS n=1 Tax=Andreesenia angusta TaxID=39480 RepID=A0A1S1V8Q0_9FIRM|nr:ribosome silencing factor [Andreesenia angusta]OHW62517.1 ribosomal silencing factor RsfS [Andreesenia angusta]